MLRGVVPLVLVIAAACGSADEHFDRERTGALELVVSFGGPPPDAAIVKTVLVTLGQRDIQIEPARWHVDGLPREAIRITIAYADWPPAAAREELVAEITRAYGAALEKIAWAGNAIHVRATSPLDQSRLRDLVTKHDLVVRDIQVDQDDGTGEYHAYIRVGGIDAQVERALEAKLPGTDVVIESSLAVGPRKKR